MHTYACMFRQYIYIHPHVPDIKYFKPYSNHHYCHYQIFMHDVLGNQLILISRDRPAQSLRRTVFTKSVSVSTGKAQTIKWNLFVEAALKSESFRAAMLLFEMQTASVTESE